jgi:hypothetical protein
MKRLRSILGIVAIFVLGVIAGGLITLRIIDVAQRKAFEGGGGAVADLVARRISLKLRADAAQREQIRLILRDTAKDFESVREQVGPQLNESLEKTETRLRAVLKPDQQKEFDLIMERARQNWKKRTSG